MRMQSCYVINCPNCVTTSGSPLVIESHEPDTKCPRCGMGIRVEGWGKMPIKVVVGSGGGIANSKEE
jgi:uncharacterized paraquat-inducible protein A